MRFIVWLRSCLPFSNIGSPFFNYQKFEETAVKKKVSNLYFNLCKTQLLPEISLRSFFYKT